MSDGIMSERLETWRAYLHELLPSSCVRVRVEAANMQRKDSLAASLSLPTFASSHLHAIDGRRRRK